jgi:hypothetical protein
VLGDCLEAARERVGGRCGCDKSCYGCLRNYRNQFAHQDLQRGPIMSYLEILLSKWKRMSPTLQTTSVGSRRNSS